MIYYTVNIDNYIADLKPPPWIHVIDEVKESTGDPVRDSRIPKIRCPFSGPSVYIDASKVHLIGPKFLRLTDKIFEEHDLFVLQHPHEHTYIEECAEYIHRGWVSEEDIFFFTDYVKSFYDFSKHFQSMGTIIWRRDQQDFNDRWWDLYLRGGVRDQLSMAVALPEKYGHAPCREFINQFSDASPEGIWWQNKGGDYNRSVPRDPHDVALRLCKETGLSRFRYRTRLSSEGELRIGKTL